MTAVPRRFLAQLTRHQLAEMLAPSYAELRNIDVNEAHLRLEPALRSLRLIEGLQRGTWRGLEELKPNLGEDAILELVTKKLAKNKRFQPIKRKAAEEGPIAALTVLIENGAGISSGEAFSLLDSPQAEVLLEKGFLIIGRHLARELAR